MRQSTKMDIQTPGGPTQMHETLRPERLDVDRLQDDFANYYAPNLLRVRNESGKIVPLKLRPEQLKADNILTRAIKRHRTFIFALKSRQVGISTWAEGRLFHRSHMFKNAQTFVMAHEAKASDNIFGMTKRYYDNLDVGYRPMIRYSNKKELTFENPSKDTYFANPGLKSRITVFTAGTKDSTRSFTADCGHLSEFAYYPDGAKIIAACEAGIPESPGNFLIAETTGNGVDNFAYDLWHYWTKQYKRFGDDSQYIPFFLGWHEISKYSKLFDRPEYRQNLMASLDDLEKNLIRRFNVTPEQLNWRRSKITAYAGDMPRFMENFPSDPEEAFISTGRPVFDIIKLQSQITRVTPPIFVGEINHSGHLLPLSTGRLSIYRYPEDGHDYILGVDPKGDSDNPNSDECAIQVLDRATLTQVAEWVSLLEPIAMVPYIRALGIMYGTDQNRGQALVAVERNNSGLTVLYELDKDYYNIYVLEKFIESAPKETKKLGWETNTRTKPLLVDFATFCFHSDYSQVNSLSLLKEMRKFIANKNSASAERGAADNRVMAWMIALFIAGKSRVSFVKENAKPYIEPKKPVEKYSDVIGKWRSSEINMNNLNPNLLDTHERYDSWMAY